MSPGGLRPARGRGGPSRPAPAAPRRVEAMNESGRGQRRGGRAAAGAQAGPLPRPARGSGPESPAAPPPPPPRGPRCARKEGPGREAPLGRPRSRPPARREGQAARLTYHGLVSCGGSGAGLPKHARLPPLGEQRAAATKPSPAPPTPTAAPGAAAARQQRRRAEGPSASHAARRQRLAPKLRPRRLLIGGRGRHPSSLPGRHWATRLLKPGGRGGGREEAGLKERAWRGERKPERL